MQISNLARLALTTSLALTLVLPASGAVVFPPAPAIPAAKPVTEDFFGTKVTDPYRYFENIQDPVVKAFFKNENAYTRTVLSKLGNARSALFARIKQLDNAGVSVGGVVRDGPYYFYQKLKPGENSQKLYVRLAAGGPEHVLVDPAARATAGKHFNIDYFLPSLSGKYVAYGISEGGSEAAVIHIVETATGKDLPDSIDRAYFVGATSWRPDDSFYYVRFPQLKPGESAMLKETRAVNYLHVIGRNPDQDVPVFGYGVNPAVTFAATDFPIVVYSPVSNYVLGIVAHGVQNEQTIYVTDGPPTSATASWKKLIDTADAVTGIDFKGSTAYLLTHKDAPTFKVVAVSLAANDVSGAQTLVAAGKEIVLNVGVAVDGLYVQSRLGGFGRIRKIALGQDGAPAASAVSVRFPFQGAVNAMTVDSREPGVTFGLTGWTHSLLWYYANAAGAVRDTRLKPLAPVSAAAYTSSEVEARSGDGTMVPLSIVYRKTLKLDGSHPAYLEGYSSYGITIDPGFSTTRIAWLERGGVYAVCHARGGGWYGEAWHRAGMIATKPHTWQDFIACGQYLVQHGYTAPSHLAGEGTSAGGITIGRAITTRPDLFAAALDVVGVSNAMRSEFSPNGPPNIPEFGSVKTPEGAKALYAMDAYQHVVNGTKYPAVMLITGYNDPRVSSWELAKFTARLQQATASGRPILLRVDYDAGHGFLASSRKQSEELLTDQYSFLLWQCGDPAFAGIPQRMFRVGR